MDFILKFPTHGDIGIIYTNIHNVFVREDPPCPVRLTTSARNSEIASARVQDAYTYIVHSCEFFWS